MRSGMRGSSERDAVTDRKTQRAMTVRRVRACEDAWRQWVKAARIVRTGCRDRQENAAGRDRCEESERVRTRGGCEASVRGGMGRLYREQCTA